MSNTTHTPALTLDGHCVTIDGDAERLFADCSDDGKSEKKAKEHAALIVKAVNNHEALANGHRAIVARINGNRAEFEALGYLWTDSESDDVLDVSRALLAKVEV